MLAFFNILISDYYLLVGIKHMVLLSEQFYIVVRPLGFLFVKVVVIQILPIYHFITFFLHRTIEKTVN